MAQGDVEPVQLLFSEYVMVFTGLARQGLATPRNKNLDIEYSCDSLLLSSRSRDIAQLCIAQLYVACRQITQGYCSAYFIDSTAPVRSL